MEEIIKVKIVKSGQVIEYPKGISIESIAKDFQSSYPSQIVAAIVNNDIRELSKSIDRNSDLDFIDMTTEDGVRIYQRGLMFIAYVASKELFPDKN
jgi:uridine kinase